MYMPFHVHTNISYSFERWLWIVEAMHQTEYFFLLDLFFSNRKMNTEQTHKDQIWKQKIIITKNWMWNMKHWKTLYLWVAIRNFLYFICVCELWIYILFIFFRSFGQTSHACMIQIQGTQNTVEMENSQRGKCNSKK